MDEKIERAIRKLEPNPLLEKPLYDVCYLKPEGIWVKQGKLTPWGAWILVKVAIALGRKFRVREHGGNPKEVWHGSCFLLNLFSIEVN